MLEYMKKRPGPAGTEPPGFEGSGEISGPAVFAQAALARERSRPIDLEAGIRQRMEAHFGLDFGKVRLAQSDLPGKMGVDAIAQGDLIRFAPGAYRPGSSEGEKLLGHELGHLVRQSRMGPGLAGVPIDDPVSESGADNLATSAHSGTAGAVHAFTPVPAASAPMEGGRLWNRVKQDANRWFGGKLGSWWRRKRNKNKARGQAELNAQAKSSAQRNQAMSASALNSAANDISSIADQRTNAPDFWNDEKNPLLDHPEFYPEYIMPKPVFERLSSFDPGDLNPQEMTTLRSMAGNRDLYNYNTTSNLADYQIENMPTLSRVFIDINNQRKAALRQYDTQADPNAPKLGNAWEATASQLGGSSSNPFDNGELGVWQEAIDNAESVDEVHAALDKYVLGHKTTGKIGGESVVAAGNSGKRVNQRDLMDLDFVKKRAKLLSRVVQDVPEIAPLIKSHSDTSSNSRAEMFVNFSGEMGWDSSDTGAARWGLGRKVRHYQDVNSDDPLKAASTLFSAVHESGHLVEQALTRKAYRAVDPTALAAIYNKGNVSDVLIRHVLTEMVREGNKDAVSLLVELQKAGHAGGGFKSMDLRPTKFDHQSRRNVYGDSTAALMQGLKKRGFTSRYGATDPMEAFAESYARVYEQGEDADEFTKRLVRTSQELMRDPRELDRVFKSYSHEDTNLDFQPLPPAPEPAPAPAPEPAAEPKYPEDGREYPIIVRYISPEGSEAPGDASQPPPAPAPVPAPEAASASGEEEEELTRALGSG